jgi:hypothetical protein
MAILGPSLFNSLGGKRGTSFHPVRAMLNGVLCTFDPHSGSSARKPLVPSEKDHGRLEGVKAHKRGGMKQERSIAKQPILGMYSIVNTIFSPGIWLLEVI